MIRIPVFRRNLKATCVSRDEALLRSPNGQFIVRGPWCGLVAARIDGRSDCLDIVEALRPQGESMQLLNALVLLESQGLLMDRASDLPDSQAAFWSALDVPPAQAASRLAGARFDLRCLGGPGAEQLARALSSNGVQRSNGAGCELTIVLTEDYLDPRLDALNREMRARGLPWALCMPAGAAWIGPLFHAKTACWECLATRMRENRRDAAGGFPASLPSTLEWFANLAATEIARWIVLGTSPLEQAIATVNPFTCRMDFHRVVRRPQCAVCGGNFRLDPSQLRAPPAGDLRHHLSPVTGIVPYIVRRGAAADHIPVVWTPLHRPAAAERRSGDSHAVAVGTAPSEYEAQTSCIGEALERYSTSYDGTEATVRSRASQLDGPFLLPSSLLLISDAQYRERELFNRASDGSLWIPERFDDHCELDWTPVWSVSRNQRWYVPAAYCFLRCRSRHSPHSFGGDSNGCAAGRTLDEAVARGFCELVERDALALWWYNRAPRPAIDLDSAGTELADDFRRQLARAGRTLHLLDLTTDLGLPVVAAVSAREDGSAVAVGFGARFRLAAAARRSLLEMQQVLGALDSLPRDAEAPPASWLERWLRAINLHREPWLAPASGSAPGPALRQKREEARGGPPPLALSNDDTAACLEIARRHELDLLVANLTRPDLGVPVVRVIVPGLRPAQPRFAPGRLYSVPAALGWLPEPLAESQLNPFPFFL